MDLYFTKQRNKSVSCFLFHWGQMLYKWACCENQNTMPKLNTFVEGHIFWWFSCVHKKFSESDSSKYSQFWQQREIQILKKSSLGKVSTCQIYLVTSKLFLFWQRIPKLYNQIRKLKIRMLIRISNNEINKDCWYNSCK